MRVRSSRRRGIRYSLRRRTIPRGLRIDKLLTHRESLLKKKIDRNTTFEASLGISGPQVGIHHGSRDVKVNVEYNLLTGKPSINYQHKNNTVQIYE